MALSSSSPFHFLLLSPSEPRPSGAALRPWHLPPYSGFRPGCFLGFFCFQDFMAAFKCKSLPVCVPQLKKLRVTGCVLQVNGSRRNLHSSSGRRPRRTRNKLVYLGANFTTEGLRGATWDGEEEQRRRQRERINCGGDSPGEWREGNR